jgi:hypothetical protein
VLWRCCRHGPCTGKAGSPQGQKSRLIVPNK